ncbi:CYTH domain-containing protein [Hahella sp. KA22]|uniref:CYTH domain-containing protein n=1 Tax=Hahella sp. KA22 TaxID=1628392 RepID=UPI000FDD1132|nr:CYTH domain-containing protein [Hahella sp. KA22]AZZ90460.1 CYTH domain-containing protein [Hahella sp. KA22]QAY53829.1 CYTH domain-containing protein [Hahella sp. KA22]
MKEIELKLMFPSSKHHAVLSTLKNTFGSPEYKAVLRNIYFDTPDLRLKALRTGLRIRNAGSRWEQTLKAKGGSVAGLHSRNEWNWPINSESLDLEKLQDIDALSGVNLASLIPIFTTTFERLTWNIAREGAEVELVLDVGKVTSGVEYTPLAEIEIEYKNGEFGLLFDVAEEIVEMAPCWVSDDTKASKGYGLLSLSNNDPYAQLEHDDVLMAELIRKLAKLKGNSSSKLTGWEEYVGAITAISVAASNMFEGIDFQRLGELVNGETLAVVNWYKHSKNSDFNEFLETSTAAGKIGVLVTRALANKSTG